MKNHDEFRRTVFEKAKQYEIKRKARNKKIIEIVSLCSLCLVIGISAYLGLGIYDLAPDDSIATTPFTQDAPTAATSINDSAEHPAGTDPDAEDLPSTDADEIHPIFTATTQALRTTTAAATIATTTPEGPAMTFAPTNTAATSLDETTPSTVASTTPDIPQSTNTEITASPTENKLVSYSGYCCERPNSQESHICELVVRENRSSLEYILNVLYDDCLSDGAKEDLYAMFDESFFEENVLIVLHISDYYSLEYEEKNGSVIFRYSAQNPNAVGDTALLFYSYPKDSFESAVLIAAAQ